MKLSGDRILTTHVGSLPRPQGLADLIIAREPGARSSEQKEALPGQIRAAATDVVARQSAVGIDIISAGEMSKIG